MNDEHARPSFGYRTKEEAIIADLNAQADRIQKLKREVSILQGKLDIAMIALREVDKCLQDIDCWTDYSYVSGIIDSAFKKLEER